MRNKPATPLCLGLMFLLLLSLGVPRVAARQQAGEIAGNAGGADGDLKAPKPTEGKTANSKREETTANSASVEDRLKAMEQIIERQQREIQTLRDMVEKKGADTASVRPADAVQTQGGQPQAVAAAAQTPASGKNEATPPESQKKIDELYKKFGAIRFSGDLRFRAETFRNQGFDALAESADRNRLRVRARLAL